MKNQFKVKELLRFLVGGGSAVLVDYIVYRVLLSFGIDTAVSKAVSFICGSIVGFIINKLWTFESKNFSKSEIFRYIILYTITAGINAWINNIVLYLFSIQVFAFLCATGVSTVLNFLGQKFFVFKK
ncbi:MULTISPECIES: GtrA family protein [unclassified Clostridium]|uniref:GtrA family protein n=1 Tax=unclassified Clostridium TaxID=2614128 RepID=UPI0002981740|nr:MULTISPECIES: GtrA family protein [unclassified Clostridium]EKQ50527.1 MAG: putative membrane protein [Clostridium sp. Maddingley MBC34-26]